MKHNNLIQLDQYYEQPPAAVWKALTDPELHARWWAAGDVRPVVGHKFELDMGNWGKQPCEVLEVVPERLFKYRFTPDWTLTWRLQPEGSGTRLTLLHEGFDPSKPKDVFALENMSKGWPAILVRLGATVAARLAS
ncbi:SRPBCC family protein [Hyalangium gracile]|uniref:SRPBCC family protein n=1 Tax=Hyalangium gracile TaxID=394092 RepID=UPI001CCB9FF3|nr:SRPBCC domain-containing protein [Hyalangium gracile]